METPTPNPQDQPGEQPQQPPAAQSQGTPPPAQAAAQPAQYHPPTSPNHAPYAQPEPESLGDSMGIRMMLPVGRSGWAIAAGYLGLFSVLALPAPLALICGVIAVINIKKNPKKHGMGRAIFGIVMGLLGSAGLLFAIAAGIFSR
jgi:hypothetical protein